MAQTYFKINLQNTDFPLLSTQQTRTIIGTSRGAEEQVSPERPAIQYCHNIMPSDYGVDSVGYTTAIPPPEDPDFLPDVDDTRIIYGSLGSRIYMTWDLVGNIYVILPGDIQWLAIADVGFGIRRKDFTANSVTIGTVNGISYIMFANKQCFIYDEDTNALAPVTLAGLDITAVLGVAASSGYLIAYTKQDVAWSSTIDPTDFIPSQVTGAGGGSVDGTEGEIQFCLSNSLGILVYTFANVVAGTYTGNVLYPFKFRPVDDSKGGITLDRVAYEANATQQFAYTKGGLQAITSTRATTILPEVTDFLSGKRFEDFNEITNEYEGVNLTEKFTMLKKIKYVASRYLIMSYGLPKGFMYNEKVAPGYFTHALVYDTALEKLGKLRIEHVDVFEYVGPQTEIAKETIAFLLPGGEVKTLHSSILLESYGVLVLGKLQETRERMIQLLSVELENVGINADADVIDSAALNGKKDITLVPGYLRTKGQSYMEFLFRATAKNHSLIIKGRYNLVTVLVKYATGGRR